MITSICLLACCLDDQVCGCGYGHKLLYPDGREPTSGGVPCMCKKAPNSTPKRCCRALALAHRKGSYIAQSIGSSRSCMVDD